MKISSAIAQLRTTNLAESIRFYTTKVGLTLEFQYQDFYAGIRAGSQLFHLKLSHEKDPSIEFVDEGDHFHLPVSPKRRCKSAFRLTTTRRIDRVSLRSTRGRFAGPSFGRYRWRGASRWQMSLPDELARYARYARFVRSNPFRCRYFPTNMSASLPRP